MKWRNHGLRGHKRGKYCPNAGDTLTIFREPMYPDDFRPED